MIYCYSSKYNCGVIKTMLHLIVTGRVRVKELSPV